ncbi:helix-turn-helix transcriptional regulator [Pseudolysinimonas sp.]|uniref:helix-turn-helix transcriptional regulator n=1 Tax=Pseudolysinimonas sp. TaxID=2680009 RepID=UPI003F80F5E6
METDRAQLADFLRTRREALQPEDVGLPRGPRRRTAGLRREEVAQLVGMSADYYGRLEQQRGPQPSVQMLQAIARGLHLSRAERDHLFRLAGHPAPTRPGDLDHVAPGILRIMDRLRDTPALVLTETGETLLQTPLASVILGDASQRRGFERATGYRWFTDPSSRAMYHPDDHELHGRVWVAELRAALSAGGPGSRAAELVAALQRESPEFSAIWAEHEVAEKALRTKRFRHPEVGDFVLDCETLLDTETQQRLLVLTAAPGSDSAEKLALLAVVAEAGLVSPST